MHDEAWTKVTVVLFDRQIVFLDQLARTIRAKHGTTLSRAQLIRAFVDSIDDANLDLTGLTSERDVKRTLVKRLSRADAVSALSGTPPD